MTLTILSLSLCGGLLSESAPSARLLAQNDEVLAAPLPEPRELPTREGLRESMPGLGGPIALIICGGVLTVAALYVIPLLIGGTTGLIVMILATIAGGVMTGVGIGTLIGNIVRRARINRGLRRLDPYGFEPLEPRGAPAPAVAMLTLSLP